jgi:hypothetical protein
MSGSSAVQILIELCTALVFFILFVLLSSSYSYHLMHFSFIVAQTMIIFAVICLLIMRMQLKVENDNQHGIQVTSN